MKAYHYYIQFPLFDFDEDGSELSNKQAIGKIIHDIASDDQSLIDFILTHSTVKKIQSN